MQIQSIGVDLKKTTFHLMALGAADKLLVKNKFTQKQYFLSEKARFKNGQKQTLSADANTCYCSSSTISTGE